MRELSGTGTEESNPAYGLLWLLATFSDEADEADEAAALSPAELKLTVGRGEVSCTPIPVRGVNKSAREEEIIGLSRLSAALAKVALVGLSAASAEVPLVGLSADDDALALMGET